MFNHTTYLYRINNFFQTEPLEVYSKMIKVVLGEQDKFGDVIESNMKFLIHLKKINYDLVIYHIVLAWSNDEDRDTLFYKSWWSYEEEYVQRNVLDCCRLVGKNFVTLLMDSITTFDDLKARVNIFEQKEYLIIDTDLLKDSNNLPKLKEILLN